MRKMIGLLVLIPAACCSPWARADISSFQATASSAITQLQGGSVIQRDVVSHSYPGEQTSMPVEAGHRLSGSTAAGSWSAFDRVLVNDPQYNQAVPRDFILESSIGSADPSVSLQVNSQVRQTRRINLRPSEFPNHAAGDVVQLNSKFLLEGALAAVVPLTTSSAEGLQINCNLKISKDQSSVWDGTIRMVGQSDGTFRATASGDFRDNDFVLARNTVPDLATISLLVFGGVDLPFSYQGAVGDSFDLTAEMNLDYAVPGGLAAGSAFGTVPAEIISLSESLFVGSPLLGVPMGESIAAPEPGSVGLMLAGMAMAWRRRTARR